MRAAVIAALLALTPVVARADDLPPPPGQAQPQPPDQPPADPADALAQANAAATAGDWEAVARYVAPLLPGASLGKGDQAEAHRLAGLSAYFLGRYDDAERELLAYLQLDVDARLDPAVVPPEAVTFFEDVRARHGAELRALRPHGRKHHYILNFIPPFGQFQNGDRTKGWIVAGGLVAFLATNVTTYFVLRDWCSGEHQLCEPGGSDHAGTARRLRIVNTVTGIGALALYAYGVIDGIRHYHSTAPLLRVEPTNGGGVVMLSGRW